MIWTEYLRGRSIAVVGPAPMPVDQSTEIDAHDLVYRPIRAPIGGHYGNRLDIAFLNGGWGRNIYDDDKTPVRETIEQAAWWVFKKQAYRKEGFYRKANKPRLVMNPNAITAILFDLVKEPTNIISVYGADLYASGPDNAYEPNYAAWHPEQVRARAFLAHEPLKQMRIHRAIHQTGRVVGDDRYLAAVTMTDAEYQSVIDRWAAVLEEATV